MKRLLAFFSLCAFTFTAQAAIQSKAVHYEHEGAKLTGYLYWDDKVKGKGDFKPYGKGKKGFSKMKQQQEEKKGNG